MITTYLIEKLSDHSVMEYYRRLYQAKEDLEKLPENEYRVMAFRGPSFGEGYHLYQVTYSGRVFLKQPVKY